MNKKPKPPAEPMSDRLRHAIERSGMSRYEVAKRAGVSQAMVDRFVSRERSLNLRTAEKLAALFGFTLEKTSNGQLVSN